MKRWLPDAVSLARIPLAVLLARCLCTRSLFGVAVIAAIVVSDLVDGRLARWLGTAGSRGALIDAGCDAVVVLTAACALGLGDPRCFWMAGLMALAFISYGAYSLVIHKFAYTRLGRYDGALCYALVAVAAFLPWLVLAGIRVPAAFEWTLIGPTAAFLALSSIENIAGAIMHAGSLPPRAASFLS